MRAIAYTHFGAADVLQLVDLQKPIPKEDEVQIRLAYTGVNPVDYKIRLGLFKDAFPHRFPVIPGWEGAGVVTAVGSKCSRIKLGDKVYGYFRLPEIGSGTYAEYIVVPESYVALIPKKLSSKEASGIALTGLTAWQALFDAAHLKENNSVLIHAAAGGVGSMAVQFAKWKKARVYATASQANYEYVKQLGADVVIDYRNENVTQALLSQVPGGVDVVLDCVGGQVTEACFDCVRPGGIVVSVVDRDVAAKARAGKKGCFVFVAPNVEQLNTINTLFDTGLVKAPEVQELSIEEARLAQERVEAGHTKGKIVLRVDFKI